MRAAGRSEDQTAAAIRKVEGGFPHSEIPGSKLVRSSPRLIAAYHVLHRLSAPRHPPNALKTLDRSRDRCPSLIRQPSGWPISATRSQKDQWQTRFRIHHRMLAEHDRRADALARPTATFPLHDVTDVFARWLAARDQGSSSGTAAANCVPDSQARHPFRPSPQQRRQVLNRWWSQTGSNRRPHACKARALPTELWPQGVSAEGRASRVVVGLGRLERPTSPLSGVRSNHLSYRPRAIEARHPGHSPERCADRAIW
jgi:hypothetical protein